MIELSYLETSADGDKIDPCLTRADHMNHDSCDNVKWSPGGQSQLDNNWCSSREIMTYMVSIITTELITINSQTRGEKGSRMFLLLLPLGDLIRMVNCSTPKLWLNLTAFILLSVMENNPAPTLTSPL